MVGGLTTDRVIRLMPRRKKTVANCRICASDRHCQYHQKYDMMELREQVYKKRREGYSYPQIARAYGISTQTVKRYIRFVRVSQGGMIGDDVEWTDVDDAE